MFAKYANTSGELNFPLSNIDQRSYQIKFYAINKYFGDVDFFCYLHNYGFRKLSNQYFGKIRAR